MHKGHDVIEIPIFGPNENYMGDSMFCRTCGKPVIWLIKGQMDTGKKKPVLETEIVQEITAGGFQAVLAQGHITGFIPIGLS